MSNLISVIIPIYNTKEYLNKCLQSILNQSYTNLEILLIDDASTDGSSEMCDYYSQLDKRIKVWHQKIKSGVSNCRNLGLKYAAGEWISFIDSDDWLNESMYEDLMKQSIKDEVDIICCDAWIWRNGKRKKSGIWRKLSKNEYICSKDETLNFILDYSGTLWNKIFRATNAKKIFFDETLQYGEDMVYLANYLTISGEAVIINKPEYNYRIDREGNIVSAKLNKQYLDYFKATEKLIEILVAYDEYYVAINRCVDVIVRVLHLIPIKNWISYKEYMEAAEKLSKMIKPFERRIYIGKYNTHTVAKKIMLLLARKPLALSIVYSKVYFVASKK